MPRVATFSEVLEEEKWVSLAMLQEGIQSPPWKKMRSPELPADFDPESIGLEHREEVEDLRAVSDRQIINNLIAYLDASIIQARLPYQSNLTPPDAPKDPLSRRLYPQLFLMARTMSAINQTRNALLVTTLALQAYKQERKGKYPEMLGDLVPAHLLAIPLDPFSGAPLKYRLTDEKYLLYSIGPDRQDDGGTPIDDASKNAGRYGVMPESKGDIVAGVNN
jgi:hypothetical protein